MAVKKVTAKKSVAKKATAKKSIAKKTPAKRSAAKKSAAKKAPAKKTAVKKSAAKKTAAKKSAVERIVIPEAPIIARPSRVEIVSTPSPLSAPTPAPTPATTPAPTPATGAVATPTPVQPPTSIKKEGASGRVIFAVLAGVIILGLIVWGQSNNSNEKAAKSTPTPTVSSTPTATPEVSASPTPTAVTISAHEAPQGVVAHYTSTGATIFWKAPSASDGLTGYNIEISLSNGPWKLISSVPVTQLHLDVTKENSTGWTSFRVSSVYSDGEATPAKAFGLPGTYS